MLKRISLTLNIILLLIALLLSFALCSKKERVKENKVYLIKRDTLIRYDTVKLKDLKLIIKPETIKLKDTIIIKSDTSFSIPIYKFSYKDTILSLNIYGFYIDTNRIEYKINLKPKIKRYDNILTIGTNFVSYSVIYQKRVFFNFYLGTGIDYSYFTKDFTIKAYLSLIW